MPTPFLNPISPDHGGLPRGPESPAVAVPSWRGVIQSLTIDGLCPLLIYSLLTSDVVRASTVTALAVGAIFPALNGLVGILRRRHVDIIGAVVLVGIAVSIIATMIGGDPKLMLIRESFVTGALGFVCLLSLLSTRPLMTYIARQFSTGDDPAKVQAFNELWHRTLAPRTFRVLTVVWALRWMGEFALRVVMVETSSIPHVLAISPIVFNGIMVGLFAWTFAYVRHQRQRASASV
jgi:hypothetical protein